MRIVIVTGMSGAGKSSALRLFEDMGYYCMDNIPPSLMLNFIDLAKATKQHFDRVALGVDIRGGEFFDQLQTTMEALRKEEGMQVQVLFLTARDEVLVRRYKEHRRPHPMDKAGNIYDGIQREKIILEDLRSRANFLIDTSDKTLGQLKEAIDQLFLPEGESPDLYINLSSFGYKYGIALDADLVLDVRFLKNPYYIPELKALTGRDQALQDFVLSFSETELFLDKFLDFLHFLIPLYIREGKRTLSIALGCTGGRHRSVALAEILAGRLQKDYRHVRLSHRDASHWK